MKNFKTVIKIFLFLFVTVLSTLIWTSNKKAYAAEAVYGFNIKEDVNGDNKDDLLRFKVSDGRCILETYLSNGSGFTLSSIEDVGIWVEGLKIVPLDINGDGKKDFVKITKNGSGTNAEAYISNGGNVNGRDFTLLSIEDMGGWSDNIKTLATDINGDGKSDLVRIWNNNGKAYAATFISNGQNINGRTFSPASNVEVGDWSDQSDAFSMDINGDGKSDLVRVWRWNDRTIAGTFTSNGYGYNLTSIEDLGGWADNIKNIATDINGDGKSDLVRIWNNSGKAYAATYISNGGNVNGRVFSIGNNVEVGDWSDQSDAFCMDINGDGKLDLVRVWRWNDRSIAGIYISNGKDYTLAGVEDMGGWADNIKNLPMDISGDNKADLVRVWNNSGKAYAATYISNGGNVNGRVFSIGNNVNIGDWMEDLDVVTLPARSNIDSPSNGQSINSDQDVNITGWAVAPRLKEVQIFVDNNFLKVANYGLSRPDISQAYPGYSTGSFCGFTSNLGRLSPGTHTLLIKVIDGDGKVTNENSILINIKQFIDTTYNTDGRVSNELITFIKSYESFSSLPYDDGTGVMTIGYGTTRKDRVALGYCTEAQASQWLMEEVNDMSAQIKSDMDRRGVKLKQNEFDSLVSFAYNCGVYSLLNKSNLYQRVCQGVRDETLRSNFLAWVNGGNRVMQGLINRRNEECDMFLYSDYKRNL